MDEEKFLSASSKTNYTVYNSALANVMKGVRHHADALPASVVDLISRQPGVENGRSLYRNTLDDDGVAVDYGFEDLIIEDGSWENEDGRSYRTYDRYLLFPAPDAENLLYGNIYGASWQFIEDLTIFDGEKDTAVLRQKMATGDYVILGCDTDRVTGKPAETPLTRQLGTGDLVSFYKNGELLRTCTILARANVVGTEREILTANMTEMNIGGDAPRLYMTDEMFGQLRRLMVYEGLYYAAGAYLIGGAAAAVFVLTVLRNALNSPSMWFFSLRFTLALAVAAVYLLLASVIPVVALHCCNKGTVVERLGVRILSYIAVG